jgi:hypothetical protein
VKHIGVFSYKKVRWIPRDKRVQIIAAVLSGGLQKMALRLDSKIGNFEKLKN